MAFEVDGIYLSMTNPETGDLLTANVYTVAGVYETDGVTPRLLSIGQLVMAICLSRAAALESEIIDKMDEMELISQSLELMTQIENEVLAGTVDLKNTKLTYDGYEMSYFNFLVDMGVANPPDSASASNTDFINDLESVMDSKNSFSQQSMIELQSLTNKRDQSYDMVSNIIKSLNTTLVGNVNNM